MIDLVYAHPYPDRSRANRILLDAVSDLPEVEIRSLYDLYPDFAIDVEREQEVLLRSRIVVWQHPIHWYGPPSILKLWFEKVLAHGFAYGPGGRALAGKTCLWVTTAGGDDHAYSEDGVHGAPFPTYEPPMRQTARFCGMEWADPFVLLASHRCDERGIHVMAEQYRARLASLVARVREAGDA